MIRAFATGVRPVRLGAAGPFAWSPDGRSLALDHGPKIELVDASGRNRRTLVVGGEPAWRPDGALIAYAVLGRCAPSKGIWITDLAGRRRQLTHPCG